MKSTRLPGKPLLMIDGKTMIHRTWERCCRVLSEDSVYVATESEAVCEEVRSFGGNAILTSGSCLTGTDRVAEANKTLNFDLIINVQGDEPIIDPKNITHVLNSALANPTAVINAYSKIDTSEEYRSLSVPKVIFSKNNHLLYMSRAPVPCNKGDEFITAYKQICIYAFPKKHLEAFVNFGRKSHFEYIEDIEILRFVENGIQVKMVEVSATSFAVDTLEDYEKIKKLVNGSN
jgi:3-deoxy-manno-octulosonate cytidylyltransferase (CMP-KDO synthetase)